MSDLIPDHELSSVRVDRIEMLQGTDGSWMMEIYDQPISDMPYDRFKFDDPDMIRNVAIWILGGIKPAGYDAAKKSD